LAQSVIGPHRAQPSRLSTRFCQVLAAACSESPKKALQGGARKQGLRPCCVAAAMGAASLQRPLAVRVTSTARLRIRALGSISTPVGAFRRSSWQPARRGKTFLAGEMMSQTRNPTSCQTWQDTATPSGSARCLGRWSAGELRGSGCRRKARHDRGSGTEKAAGLRCRPNDSLFCATWDPQS